LLAEIVVGGMSGGFVQTLADKSTQTIAIPTGILKFATGAVFPVGLMLVVIGGSELFTGNCMFAPISWLDKKITLKGFAINWTLVYIGNLIGALFVVYFLAYWSGLFSSAPFATWSMNVANGKLGLTWDDALLRGIGCNWLVCLAVWLAISSDEIIGKILGIWFPIMAFVAIGFEHSVANMFFIPLGIALANDAGVVTGSKAVMTNYPNLGAGLTTDWTHFIVNNLIPVTIGNILGAIIFVAAIYWWVYIRSPLCIATPAAPAAAPAK
jgi:formate/nitrite transporter